MRSETVKMLAISLGMATLFILAYPRLEPFLPFKSQAAELQEKLAAVEAELAACRQDAATLSTPRVRVVRIVDAGLGEPDSAGGDVSPPSAQ